MMKDFLLLKSYSKALAFRLQHIVLLKAPGILPTQTPLGPRARPSRKLMKTMRAEVQQMLGRDADNIANGLYPARVLNVTAPSFALRNLKSLALNSLRSFYLRAQRKHNHLPNHESEELKTYPKYFRRNYHFQPDGYLSEQSAKLYDYQVNVLFSGTADAMRRMLIPHIAEHIQSQKMAPLKALEIASGTGRSSYFLKAAFPELHITLSDLSPYYLKHARQELSSERNVDFLTADASNLPFKNAEFHIVFSSFLFHELPEKERLKTIQEAKRVLKKGGLFVSCDSRQLGDNRLYDPILKEFPRDFHEPYYGSYIKNPLEKTFKDCGFKSVLSECLYLNKVVSGIKP